MYHCAQAGKSFINRAEYRDKVLGCWTGKNIRGTLGAPFEGKKTLNDVKCYTQDLKGNPTPNDDLDLQLAWLEAIEEYGLYHVNERVLGEYRLDMVSGPWNEYGTAKFNMRNGFRPPVSGLCNNEVWKDKTFYNQLAAMQDRENLGFYEHYYSNPYKGHEEAWMLMQIRWMLFIENGKKLNLFPCAPRDWFDSGKKIVMKDAYSAFGKISFNMESSATKITCSYELKNAPEEVQIRLPHPDGRKAVKCIGGTYNPEKEMVTLAGSKNGKVELIFM